MTKFTFTADFYQKLQAHKKENTFAAILFKINNKSYIYAEEVFSFQVCIFFINKYVFLNKSFYHF